MLIDLFYNFTSDAISFTEKLSLFGNALSRLTA